LRTRFRVPRPLLSCPPRSAPRRLSHVCINPIRPESVRLLHALHGNLLRFASKQVSFKRGSFLNIISHWVLLHWHHEFEKCYPTSGHDFRRSLSRRHTPGYAYVRNACVVGVDRSN
ncbi:unnamed protein product, partial [Ectocarpus sp. 13 AM-2016]